MSPHPYIFTMPDNSILDETDDLSKRVHDMTKLLPGLGDLLCLVSEENDELKRAQGKLQRSIERLRRACVKILDGEMKDKSQVLIPLLMAICTTLAGALKQVGFNLTRALRN